MKKNNKPQPAKLTITDTIIMAIAALYILLAFTDIFGKTFQHEVQAYGGWVVLGACVIIMFVRRMPKK